MNPNTPGRSDGSGPSVQNLGLPSSVVLYQTCKLTVSLGVVQEHSLQMYCASQISCPFGLGHEGCCSCIPVQSFKSQGSMQIHMQASGARTL